MERHQVITENKEGENSMKRIRKNSLVFRIMLTVVLGIAGVSISVSGIVINLSKDVFVDTYGKSQEQVFLQIEEELNNFHENLVKIIDKIDSSWAFRLYFGNYESMDNLLAFQTVYQMQKDLEKAIPSNIDGISIMILNMQGISYINKQEEITTPIHKILESEVTQQAFTNPDMIHYIYADKGFTATTKDSKVMIATKVLHYLNSKDPYAVVYITMKEKEIEKFYHYFTSEITEFYLLNQMEQVVSSNCKEKVGTKLKYSYKINDKEEIRKVWKEQGKRLTILQKELPYYGYTAYSVIDTDEALKEMYNISELILICVGIGIVILIIVFEFTKQTMGTLSTLVENMSMARKDQFRQKIVLSGFDEVKELTTTYNLMLEDLDNYITQLMETQKEKRKAEISALQMQINPHYVYNTLTSIKWLIWQGNTSKSVQALDAFILLLRNTIGNHDEYITLNQELENLKNYVQINHIRYGEEVQVLYQIQEEAEKAGVPKLILQPFVENAFFHGFPSGGEGTISVCAQVIEQNLEIVILDNGIGMPKERLEKLTVSQKKTEHFSGIGVQNVDNRLKLLYGESYGVFIESKEGKGTKITLHLPYYMQ